MLLTSNSHRTGSGPSRNGCAGDRDEYDGSYGNSRAKRRAIARVGINDDGGGGGGGKGGAQTRVLAIHDLLDLIFGDLSLRDKLTLVEHTCRTWRAASRAGTGWELLDTASVDDAVPGVLREARATHRSVSGSVLGRVVAQLGPRLKGIRTLHWKCGVGVHSAAELLPLVTSEARPRHVQLQGDACSGLAELCGTRVLSRMERLHLGRLRSPGDSRATHAPLRSLLRAAVGEATETLCELELFGRFLLSSAVLGALAACPRLRAFTAVTVREERISARGARALAALPALTELHLNGFTMTPAVFALLAPPAVRKLHLSLAFSEDASGDEDNGRDGACHAGPHWPHLTSLAWSCSSPGAAVALAALSACHPSLEQLHLHSDVGAVYVPGVQTDTVWAGAFAAHRFPRLHTLQVYGAPLGAWTPLLALTRVRLPTLSSLVLVMPRAFPRTQLLAAFAPPAASTPVQASTGLYVCGLDEGNGQGQGDRGGGDARSNGLREEHARPNGLPEEHARPNGLPDADAVSSEDLHVPVLAPNLTRLSLIRVAGADLLQLLRATAPRNLRTLICSPLEETDAKAITVLLPSVTVSAW